MTFWLSDLTRLELSWLKVPSGVARRQLASNTVVEDVPAWSPELRSKDSVRTADTRYFVDPSIAATALGVMSDDLVNDLRTFGYFFESLAIRDLRAYMDAQDGEVRHYHDKTGLECDAVLRTWSGAYALVEIKTGGANLTEEGVLTLNKLSRLIAAKGMTPPRFMMVLTATGEFAYRRKEDGIIVCPLSALRQRDVHKVDLLLRSLARNESTSVSVATLCSDIAGVDHEKIDSDTVSSYLNALKGRGGFAVPVARLP